MSDTIVLPPQGLILPPGVVPPVPEATAEQVQQQTAKQLPEPKGWKILCAVVDVAESYDSGLLKAAETKLVEEQTSPVLFVLKVGDIAYQDETKFPTGAWCKEGDFVLTRPYTGTRVMIFGKEFRIINDDQVEAVVEDPRGIRRA